MAANGGSIKNPRSSPSISMVGRGLGGQQRSQNSCPAASASNVTSHLTFTFSNGLTHFIRFGVNFENLPFFFWCYPFGKCDLTFPRRRQWWGEDGPRAEPTNTVVKRVSGLNSMQTSPLVQCVWYSRQLPFYSCAEAYEGADGGTSKPWPCTRILTFYRTTEMPDLRSQSRSGIGPELLSTQASRFTVCSCLQSARLRARAQVPHT